MGEGSLPTGWAKARLGEIAEIQGGIQKQPSRSPKSNAVSFLRVANVHRGRLDLREIHQIELFPGELDRLRLCPGDLLVVEGNGSKTEIGRVGIWSGEVKDCVHQNHLIRVRSKGAFEPKFAAAYLNSAAGTSQLIQLASSTSGLHSLGVSKLSSVEIPLAPLAEQARIVAAIEQRYGQLDAAIAALQRARANLKRYRASVLKAACEGRLVPTEAELARSEGRDYEPANKLLTHTTVPPRPNRFKTRTRDVIPGHAALSVGDTNAPLPEGWARAAMVDVARMESGHTPSRNHPEWWDGDVPWIGIADAREHHGQTIFDTDQRTNSDGLANSAARLLPAGTICISRTASVGYVVVMGRPMATSQDFVNWTCTGALNPGWARLVFLADRNAFLRFGKGTVHNTIYFPEWLSLHIAVPPLAEQERIVAEVERRLSVVAEIETQVEADLRRAASLRQSILREAFAGKLLPQDPRDEPVSLLLARIRGQNIEGVKRAPEKKKRGAAKSARS